MRPAPSRKGSVELFLIAEGVSMPEVSSGFVRGLYRPTGLVYPYEEFDGPWQIYRFARGLTCMDRRFGPGDAIVVRFSELNRITTLVPLDRKSPVLWNGEKHRLFERTPGVGDVLLQLPRSFQPSRAPNV